MGRSIVLSLPFSKCSVPQVKPNLAFLMKPLWLNGAMTFSRMPKGQMHSAELHIDCVSNQGITTDQGSLIEGEGSVQLSSMY
jgi:hypothetical protein